MNEYVNIKDELNYRKILIRKLDKVLSKSPVIIIAEITKDDISFFLLEKEIFKYTIDYSLTEKDNIFNIRKELFKYFPIIEEMEEIVEDYSIDEMKDLTSKGISVEDVLSFKKIKKVKKSYRIIRVNNIESQICIQSLDDYSEFVCYVKSPAVLMIKIKNLSPIDAGKIFFKEIKFRELLKKGKINSNIKKEYKNVIVK